MGFLSGKKILITGLLSNRSIAYGIAKACHREGAELAFTYVGERFKDRIVDFAKEFNTELIFDCDVSSDEQIEALFKDLAKTWPQFDGFVHAIGFAPREAIAGDFLDGFSREAYRIAHDISAYSLIALAQRVEPLMTHGGSILAMSYYGAEKVIPNYNIMGVAKASLEACTRYLAWDMGKKAIRVNCISAGPVQTLAARGIAGFGQMIKQYEDRAPLGRSCSLEEIGATGVFLASDGAASISGQVLYVDGGYQIMGM
jgi:enoyl-[acyl-carrier protein] reductase I